MGYDNSDVNDGKRITLDSGLDFDITATDKSMNDFALAKRERHKAKDVDGYQHDELRQVSTREFAETFYDTKKAQARANPQDAWRVSDVNAVEFDRYHPDAKRYITSDKSTLAVKKDGDIVAVCKHPDEAYKGKELIAMAVEKGGCKLDSYDGNHGFYTKCGFEPVSWCKWDDKYAPDDWKEGRDEKEDIIFYRYTGKKDIDVSYDDFKENVVPSRDYDEAYRKRDKTIGKD